MRAEKPTNQAKDGFAWAAFCGCSVVSQSACCQSDHATWAGCGGRSKTPEYSEEVFGQGFPGVLTHISSH